MNDYHVEQIAGCTVVRGALPLGDLAALAKSLPRNAVLDGLACMRLGATFVAGTPEQLQALRATDVASSEAVQGDIARARAAGLSQPALDWLDSYERGTSSNRLFAATTGVAVSGCRDATPSDASDLQRCLALVRQVPEVRDSLARAAQISPAWARLSQQWDELERLHEAGDAAAVRSCLREIERR